MPGTVHGPAGDPPSGVGVDSDRHRVLAKRAPTAGSRGRVRRIRSYPWPHPVVPGETGLSRRGRGSRAAARQDGAGTAGGATAGASRRSERAAIEAGSVRLWFVSDGDRDRAPAGSQRTIERKPSSRPEWPSAGWPSMSTAWTPRPYGMRRLARAGRRDVDEHRRRGHRREDGAAVERAAPSGRGPPASTRSSPRAPAAVTTEVNGVIGDPSERSIGLGRELGLPRSGSRGRPARPAARRSARTCASSPSGPKNRARSWTASDCPPTARRSARAAGSSCSSSASPCRA